MVGDWRAGNVMSQAVCSLFFVLRVLFLWHADAKLSLLWRSEKAMCYCMGGEGRHNTNFCLSLRYSVFQRVVVVHTLKQTSPSGVRARTTLAFLVYFLWSGLGGQAGRGKEESTRAHLCTYALTHARTHARTHAHTHTHTHTHLWNNWSAGKGSQLNSPFCAVYTL